MKPAETTAAAFAADVRRWREEWFLYQRSEGFWKVKSREWMKMQAGRFMDACGVAHTQTGKGNFLEAVLTKTLLDDDVRPPCWTGAMAHRNDTRHVYMSFRNGILDLDEWLDSGRLDRALHKPSSDFWTRCALPYAFDPEATCPRFEEAVKVWQEAPEGQLLLQGWAGYCFVPGHPEQVFLLNIGIGNDGKSQYAEVLKALVGEENVGSAGLEAFDPKKEFGLEPLLGKLLNITGDANDLDRVGEGVLKAIVGGDSVVVNRKHIAALHERLPCKFMLNANQLPPFRDRSEGIWRRLLLLNWNPVPAAKRVKDFGKLIVAKEIAGVFNWALTGYSHVKAKGFDDLRGGVVREAITEARAEVQKERQFFEERIGFDTNPDTKIRLSKEQLYHAYEQYCRANGIKKGLYGDNLAKALLNYLREKHPDHAEWIKTKCRHRSRVVEGDKGSVQMMFYRGVWLLRDNVEMDAP